VLSIILSGEDEFIKQRREEHRTVAMARERPDPRPSCQRQRSSRGRSPLRQQAGFENRHAGPDGGWWTVDGQVDGPERLDRGRWAHGE
jgi:hypothetical protein